MQFSKVTLQVPGNSNAKPRAFTPRPGAYPGRTERTGLSKGVRKAHVGFQTPHHRVPLRRGRLDESPAGTGRGDEKMWH